MRKSLPLLGSLIATSFLSADTPKNIGMAFLSSEMPVGTFRDSAPEKQDVTKQPIEVITPAVAPVVRNGIGIRTSADFIWWKSIVSGMEYATSGLHDGFFVSPTQNVSQGVLKSPKYEFQPGFKIALDFQFKHDGWDLNLQYTWLNEQQTENSIQATEGLGLASSFISVFPSGDYFNPDLFSASAKWKQSFNVLDTELGRNFFISRCLTLRPHVGIKCALIHSKLDLIYNTLPIGLEGDNPFTFDTKLTQDMWGLGIRGGVDTLWHGNKNWGIYGDIAFASLWSFFDNKEKQLEVSPTPSVYTVNTRENTQKIVNVIELGLGIRYTDWFKKDRYQFLLQAGWEEQIWLDFNNFSDVTSHTNRGSLNIQGLTLKAGFAF